MFNDFFFFENLIAYEKIWKNIVQSERPRITERRMSIACWTTKAADTYSESLILIVSLRQQ